MQKTIKLYDNDAYATRFKATILEINKTKAPKGSSPEAGDHYDIVLDRTLFFPEAGGQTPDRGVLSLTGRGECIADVEYVSIDDDVIHHIALIQESDAPEEGDTVYGEINFEYRYSNMQQHTGEHIFSGLVHRKYGYDNVGFHLSDDICTMDYNGELSADQVLELEIASNEAIYHNHPVVCRYPDDEELDRIDYRCKKELTGDIRIVTIEDVDDCACCAPHVRSTSEVGLLKVVGFERYKGGTRFTIVCGIRALKDYQEKQNICIKAGDILSVPAAEIPEALSRVMNERDELRQKIHYMNMSVMSGLAARAVSEEKHFIITDTDDDGAVRAAVNSIMESASGNCGVFFGTDESGFRFILGNPEGDVRELIEEMKSKFECRGGGKPRMAQGQIFAQKADIEEYFGDDIISCI